MFDYVEDKEFLSNMRGLCGGIVQNTCHILKEEYDIGATFFLVGSGARNLIMQNGNKPIDLDYNIEIVRCDNFGDCRYLKQSVKKAFDKALKYMELGDSEDSHSSLTSKLIHSTNGNQTEFKIDVCIVTMDDKGSYRRLIHDKTGYVALDEYYWNIAPNSKKVRSKVDYIKNHSKWLLVREEYKNIKNSYLSQNDHNHPSFICYIEAVNNVYNSRNYWEREKIIRR